MEHFRERFQDPCGDGCDDPLRLVRAMALAAGGVDNVCVCEVVAVASCEHRPDDMVPAMPLSWEATMVVENWMAVECWSGQVMLADLGVCHSGWWFQRSDLGSGLEAPRGAPAGPAFRQPRRSQRRRR